MGRHSVDFLQLCIKRQKREDTAQMERTTTPQHPQQPQRAIVHRGWLQQKMLKNGTLLRKKKVFYENELFVVLSVHNVSNGCIPRLEWFAEQSAIFERRPLKCQDLTDCQYVNVSVGDERCLAIGFVDGSAPVLELLAPSVEERAQWVDILRMTLRRLNFLNTESSDNEQQRERTDNGPSQWPRAANEYVALAGTANNDANPSTSSPPPQQTFPRANGRREVTQSPRVQMTQIPSTHLHTLSTETAQSSERSQTQLRKGLDDSLPPMRQHSAQQTNGERKGTRKTDGMTSGGESEEHCPSPSSPQNGDAFDPSHSLAPPPLPPRTPRQNAAQCSTESDAFPRTVPPLPKSPIPLSSSLNLSHYEVLTTPSSPPSRPQYDRLSAGNRHSHCSEVVGPICEVTSDEQTTPMAHYDVLCTPSAQYDVLNAPSSSALFLQQCNNNGNVTAPTERIFRDALNRSRRLFFSFTLLTEHIAFVELFDKVWIAGWTSAVDLRLRENGCSLNFGDEVEQIDGSVVRNLQALTEIYQRIMPGAQIPLLLRANPTMMVFTLVKPENARLNLGIKFNRPAKFLLRHPFDCLTIDSIALKSPAQKVNLPATVPAYLHQPAAHSVKSPQPKPFHVSSPSSPNLLPSGGTDRAVITHLDGVPLNPFGPKDQFFHRLDSVLVGHSFNVTLHSADFCSRLARQMKNQLGNKWRHFVHGE